MKCVLTSTIYCNHCKIVTPCMVTKSQDNLFISWNLGNQQHAMEYTLNESMNHNGTQINHKSLTVLYNIYTMMYDFNWIWHLMPRNIFDVWMPFSTPAPVQLQSGKNWFDQKLRPPDEATAPFFFWNPTNKDAQKNNQIHYNSMGIHEVDIYIYTKYII